MNTALIAASRTLLAAAIASLSAAGRPGARLREMLVCPSVKITISGVRSLASSACAKRSAASKPASQRRAAASGQFGEAALGPGEGPRGFQQHLRLRNCGRRSKRP